MINRFAAQSQFLPLAANDFHPLEESLSSAGGCSYFRENCRGGLGILKAKFMNQTPKGALI